MSEWQKYPRNRKISHRAGYVIIVPDDYNENKSSMPLFCDVCQIRFNNKDDEKAFKEFKCCFACANEWAYTHKPEWLNGWRPDQEKIKKSIEKRFFTNPVIVFE
jgi:hypothetical protein